MYYQVPGDEDYEDEAELEFQHLFHVCLFCILPLHLQQQQQQQQQ